MKSGWIGTKHAKLAWFVVLFFGLQVLLHLMTIANHTFGNVHWYYRIATQMHTKGFFHVWTPYPPVFSFLLYLSTTFFRTFAAFLLFWKVLNVSLVLAIALVIHRIVARQSKEIALLAALGYVLINATWTSAVTVGFYFDQFDYIPILLMMTALFTLMNQQYARSAVLSGVGAMTKFFPGVVLLIALFTLEKREKIRYVFLFALTCLMVVVPFLLINVSTLVSFYHFTSWRGAWETVWTFPHMRFPPIPKPEDLAKPFGPHSPRYSWLLWVTIASALGYVGWQGQDRTKRNMPGTALSLLLILLIFSKGVSSYYMFWIFPLLFVVYDPLPAFALCALFLVIGNLEFLHASFHPSTYWASIFARHTLFVGLLLHQILREVRTARLETQIEGA